MYTAYPVGKEHFLWSDELIFTAQKT